MVSRNPNRLVDFRTGSDAATRANLENETPSADVARPMGATPEFEIAALSLAFLCGEQEGDNRTEAVWKSTSELGYNVASMAWGGRTLIST